MGCTRTVREARERGEGHGKGSVRRHGKEREAREGAGKEG